MAAAMGPRAPRTDPPPADEAVRPQPRGEAELDACTEWDVDWPGDEDGDWSGCARDGDGEGGLREPCRPPDPVTESPPPPTPTRRRLLALLAALPALDPTATRAGARAPPGGRNPDPVRGQFAEVQARLAEHERAVERCSELEAALVAEVGYSRVRLPTPADAPARYAAEAVTIVASLAPGPRRDRLLWTLRRRRARWDAAAEARGLIEAQEREAERFQAVRATVDALYALPATSTAGVALKLLVLLSLEVPGESARDLPPWRELRLILADLGALAGSGGTSG